jgi:hypothetical protein
MINVDPKVFTQNGKQKAKVPLSSLRLRASEAASREAKNSEQSLLGSLFVDG